MSNFFEDATAYPCVIVIENRAPPSDYDIDVVYGKEKPPESEVSEVVRNIREVISKNERCNERFFITYKTPLSDLEGREWRFTPKESNELFRKLNRMSDNDLSEITKEISAGIKTGKNSVFILNNERASELGIEEELLHPIYRGSDIERYKVSYPKESVIYTEGIDDIENYPNAYKYLKQYKQELSNRKDATFKNKDKEWYEMNIPHTPESMESEKIVCREISKESNFALDRDARYILNKVYFFRMKEEYQEYYEYVLGLLNSTTLEFYVKQTSSPLRNGYYQFFTRYLEPLPIKFALFNHHTYLTS